MSGAAIGAVRDAINVFSSVAKSKMKYFEIFDLFYLLKLQNTLHRRLLPLHLIRQLADLKSFFKDSSKLRSSSLLKKGYLKITVLLVLRPSLSLSFTDST